MKRLQSPNTSKPSGEYAKVLKELEDGHSPTGADDVLRLHELLKSEVFVHKMTVAPEKKESLLFYILFDETTDQATISWIVSRGPLQCGASSSEAHVEK